MATNEQRERLKTFLAEQRGNLTQQDVRDIVHAITTEIDRISEYVERGDHLHDEHAMKWHGEHSGWEKHKSTDDYAARTERYLARLRDLRERLLPMAGDGFTQERSDKFELEAEDGSIETGHNGVV